MGLFSHNHNVQIKSCEKCPSNYPDVIQSYQLGSCNWKWVMWNKFESVLPDSFILNDRDEKTHASCQQSCVTTIWKSLDESSLNRFSFLFLIMSQWLLFSIVMVEFKDNLSVQQHIHISRDIWAFYIMLFFVLFSIAIFIQNLSHWTN